MYFTCTLNSWFVIASSESAVARLARLENSGVTSENRFCILLQKNYEFTSPSEAEFPTKP